MDELVYFSVSYHCIGKSVADEIRDYLMQKYPEPGEVTMSYGNPILPFEE